MAAENEEPLPGGGSNIIYVITPSVSNPAFKTEADVATKTAEELGYEVKAASHDDDPTKQTELFDSAIADKAAAIICDKDVYKRQTLRWIIRRYSAMPLIFSVLRKSEEKACLL